MCDNRSNRSEGPFVPDVHIAELAPHPRKAFCASVSTKIVTMSANQSYSKDACDQSAASSQPEDEPERIPIASFYLSSTAILTWSLLIVIAAWLHDGKDER